MGESRYCGSQVSCQLPRAARVFPFLSGETVCIHSAASRAQAPPTPSPDSWFLSVAYQSPPVPFNPLRILQSCSTPVATMFPTLLSVSLLALIQAATSASTFEQKCLAFRPEKYVDGATRNVLQYVKAGTTLSFADNDATCNRASQAVSADLCRMALEIKTSGTSKIAFEAWFPENWSGRFLATGNGGIDGCKSRRSDPYT
jgi:hypothetical protein